jgi:RNA polymerase sigma-70 factor, ECF subfamily
MRYSDGALVTSKLDFERVFQEHYTPLLRYLQRLTGDPDVSDDVAQETFVRLLRHAGIPEGEVRPWLYTVATNLVRDAGRKTARRKRLLSGSPQPRSVPALAEETMERREEIAAVQAALALIPLRDRQILLMREEGFRYDEIGQATGVAASSVGTLIARALKRFAEAYGSQQSEGGTPR